MSFQSQKISQLNRKDKSDKGNWDSKIEKLCKKINSRKEYYTTSSCAGRIILIKAADEKQENLFIFRIHKKINFSQLRKEIEKAAGKERGLVYFKQEPCILHVACSNIDNAQKLVDKAKFCGWKKSGMMSTRKRVVLELISTEHLEFPIINNGKILMSDEYLKLVVKEANRKLEKSWEKIKKLENLL